MASRSVVIAEPVRAAIGAFGGTLKDVPAPDLGAVAIRAAVERAGPGPTRSRPRRSATSFRPGQRSIRPVKRRLKRPAGDRPRHDREPGLRFGGAGDCVRRAGRSFWATPAPPSPAASRAWTRRLISFSTVGGVIASEMGNCTTACSATGSTTLSPANTPAGIPRIWWRNIRSRAKLRINGFCARSSASHAHSGGTFQVADRARPGSRQKGADAIRSGRSRSSRHDDRSAGAIEAGVSP